MNEIYELKRDQKELKNKVEQLENKNQEQENEIELLKAKNDLHEEMYSKSRDEVRQQPAKSEIRANHLKKGILHRKTPPSTMLCN